MTCDTFATELRSLLANSWDDGALEPSEVMVRHAGTCPTCAARLDAARALAGPDIAELEPRPDLESRIHDRLKKGAGSVTSRRWRGMALAAAAAALVLLTAGVTAAIMRSRATDGVEVHLVLAAPGATSVAVVGDWNGWDISSQSLMDADGDGVWELRFRVVPGQEYEYQFVVDGTSWISDPEALLQVDDGFGGTNSVLDI